MTRIQPGTPFSLQEQPSVVGVSTTEVTLVTNPRSDAFPVLKHIYIKPGANITSIEVSAKIGAAKTKLFKVDGTFQASLCEIWNATQASASLVADLVHTNNDSATEILMDGEFAIRAPDRDGIPFSAQVFPSNGGAGSVEHAVYTNPDASGMPMVNFLDIRPGANVTNIDISWKDSLGGKYLIASTAGDLQLSGMQQFLPIAGADIVADVTYGAADSATEILINGEVVR